MCLHENPTRVRLLLTREHAAPSTPRRIARSAQDAEIVERVRSASTHGEDVIDRQVISTDTPQVPGLPLDEPATDTEVLLGIAALLSGARARHDSDCFPVSVDERRLAPGSGKLDSSAITSTRRASELP